MYIRTLCFEGLLREVQLYRIYQSTANSTSADSDSGFVSWGYGVSLKGVPPTVLTLGLNLNVADHSYKPQTASFSANVINMLI